MSFCGPRTYSISPSSPSVLGLSGDTLTLVSIDPAEATTGPITITITADLVNYPWVTSTFNFAIEVRDYCASTVLSFAPVSDMLVYVFSLAEMQTVLATDSAS